ncbi:MAG TPA: phosphate ABC transporter substrate-binding protein [Clostridiales bacterium]|jgi:phosphate transport system substrate-binding protein|nr:phosphate ABC transporter substrate-binding protein [Clostridiales bacterium]
MKQNKWIAALLLVMAAMLAFAACSPAAAPAAQAEATKAPAAEVAPASAPEATEEPMVALSGDIIIDGSSTVFPITEAVAEEFRMVHPGVNIPIGISGTGGGFKKFIIKEIDINDASRPIKDSEAADAAANGVEFVEFIIAYDGLSVIVNVQNDFVDSLTMEELNMIWKPDSTVTTWKDVRPEWPDEKIKLYGADTDSGTFDYFTEEVNGETGAIRTDFTPSADDNVLVQGVAGDKYALGFFGYSYYMENTDKLKAVRIDSGSGPVEPTFETIKDGSYSPLSRPLFLYVTTEALAKEHVRAFITYYLTEGVALISQVGYVPLEDALYAIELAKLG